jgi:hypothetical protein
LRLIRQGDGKHILLTRSLCGPEAPAGSYEETWHVTSGRELPEGAYSLEAIFVDNTKRIWQEMTGTGNPQSTAFSANLAWPYQNTDLGE